MLDLDSVLGTIAEGGWEHWGTLQCTGSLVVGDPATVGSAHQPAGAEVLPSFVVPAQEGIWHVLVRRAPPDKALHADVEVWELCGCHERALPSFGEVYDEAEERVVVAISSGKACIVDAARRDDEAFREEVFWAGEAEIVDDAGCTTLAAHEDGEVPVFAHGSKLVDLVAVVFDWDDDGDDDEAEADDDG